jgi:hypothetical protein
MAEMFELKQHASGSVSLQRDSMRSRRIEPDLARLLRLPFVNGDAESVTYEFPEAHPYRVSLLSTAGQPLGQYGDLDAQNLAEFTKIRAIDQSTGQVVTYWTLQVYVFSSGWRWDDPKNFFHVAMLNAQGGVILDQAVQPSDVTILCGDNGRRCYATQPFRPDLYVIDAGALIYFPGGTLFQHC